MKKSFATFIKDSGYADSLVLSNLNSGVKIFTDKKAKGKNNQSDLSLLKLFKKNVVSRANLAYNEEDGGNLKGFNSDISSIQSSAASTTIV
jgi:hypothetical protein